MVSKLYPDNNSPAKTGSLVVSSHIRNTHTLYE